MPEIGDIRTGYEIGRHYHDKFVWAACIDCGKERWVKLYKGNQRCRPCANELSQDFLTEEGKMPLTGRGVKLSPETAILWFAFNPKISFIQ